MQGETNTQPSHNQHVLSDVGSALEGEKNHKASAPGGVERQLCSLPRRRRKREREEEEEKQESDRTRDGDGH